MEGARGEGTCIGEMGLSVLLEIVQEFDGVLVDENVV